MEQQEKESSPIHSSGGIPAFASIALFLVGFYILIPLFGIILSSIPVLKEWRMGTFFIGEGAMLLSVFVVCTGVCRKLIYRHPHVFAGKAAPGPSTWDELKNQEKGRASLTDELESVPATLPALMRAGKTLKRAARYGFGPADEAAARREAQAQLQQLLAGDKGTSAEREAQVGDALLALTAYCRLAGVDPELALTPATQRFVKQAEKTAPSTEQTLCADRNLEVRKNDES